MTETETVILAKYVSQLCPQQRFNEHTANAWHDVLGDLDLAEARDAAARVARRQPFVAPAEIRAEVRAVRDERLALTPVPDPPPGVGDDPAAYRRYLRAAALAIARGEHPGQALPAEDPRQGIPARPLRAITGGDQ